MTTIKLEIDYTTYCKNFNVNSTINKFQIYDALKRNKRLITPSIDTIVSYCKKELNAKETSEGISDPQKNKYLNFSIILKEKYFLI